ncbi:TIGR04282 family arsenosugar biosynthesis glycosyltransferase [Hymenobacter cavernae]|uniref:Glycosyltransferase n=1 Tax=Hymenobacter cavernae TaxID=2044852 RepID=A0ABQ1U4M4_9BACT|nr:TIGR04282 family arsenosugar biosynthesis glycosyltransferase [Hymenobacter cavernae]GGF10440.1 hypothetical protein GCM10011383_22000 [Hymenobacter cavernae]
MNHLLIFARHPELGRVKTRLAATIGAEAALAVYHELLHRTRLAADGLTGAHKTVWFAEATTAPDLASAWPGYEQALQPGGDLGQKMQEAFKQAFGQGATAAVVIGTDCPGLTATHLTAAFQALTTHDLVLGPAADGGYYLLGMKDLHKGLLRDKPWSTAQVLPATLADATNLGLSVALLPVLHDVDTADDLAAWRKAER